MKAAVIRQFGGPEVIRMEDVETPKPRPGHLLIKVLAAGSNRFEHYVRAGSIVPKLPMPHILGTNAAGEVAELGKGVTGFEVGERVIPMPGYPQKEEEYDIRPPATAPSFTLLGLGVWGTYAQYLEIPARWVLKDTTGLTPEEAATLPVALGTGVRAVKEVGQVKAGDKVLIQAGASGSSSYQIQIAKVLGAQVATTVREEAKIDFVKLLGADLVVNTRKEDFVERVKAWTNGQGADIVIDNLGGDVLARSLEATKPLGVIVAFGFAAGPQVQFDIRKLFFGQKQLRGSMASDMDELQWGLEQVRTGRIKATLDRTLPLSQATEAHRLIANNQVTGNLVLLPWVESGLEKAEAKAETRG